MFSPLLSGGDMPVDVVKFGDGIELDRNSYELRRAGRALKLERIPLDILLLLVEHRGGLVSREDIVAKIWGKDVFLDTDNSINSAIRKIRQVLKDDPENPVFVQTVTGKGYRFIATVGDNGIPSPLVILIMGVEGSGKTTVGKLLAQSRGWTFADADDFHSASNKEKMSRGVPLDDADRGPWLRAIHDYMVDQAGKGQNVVLACSALKQSYRDQLQQGLEVKLVYLKGSFDLFYQRLQERQAHFARETLLSSQFASLEEPVEALAIDASQAVSEIVEQIKSRLGLS